MALGKYEPLIVLCLAILRETDPQILQAMLGQQAGLGQATPMLTWIQIEQGLYRIDHQAGLIVVLHLAIDA